MKLKDRLAELRRERGLTLRQLREQIEQRSGEQLSISYLSELERVDTTPSMDTLTRIARGYDLSLPDLLAPVEFFDEPTDARYPASLRAFAQDRHLSPEWVETLARVEHRGKRPDSEVEWDAIYTLLRAFLDPDLSRRA